MKLTEEMVLYAMNKLINAGDSFGSDTPQEILWQLNDLKDKLDSIKNGNAETDDNVQTEEDIFTCIEDLNGLYR